MGRVLTVDPVVVLGMIPGVGAAAGPIASAAGAILGVLGLGGQDWLDWDEVQAACEARGMNVTRGTAIRLTGNLQADELQREYNTVMLDGWPVAHWSASGGWIRYTYGFTAEGFYIDTNHPQKAQRAGKPVAQAAIDTQDPDEVQMQLLYKARAAAYGYPGTRAAVPGGRGLVAAGLAVAGHLLRWW